MKECDIYEHDIHVLISDLESGQESAFDYLFVTRYKELCRFARAFVGSYVASGNDDRHRYISWMKWNKKVYTKNYIIHADLLNGGRIEFQMSERPNKLRGIGDEDVPYSFSLKRE